MKKLGLLSLTLFIVSVPTFAQSISSGIAVPSCDMKQTKTVKGGGNEFPTTAQHLSSMRSADMSDLYQLTGHSDKDRETFEAAQKDCQLSVNKFASDTALEMQRFGIDPRNLQFTSRVHFELVTNCRGKVITSTSDCSADLTLSNGLTFKDSNVKLFEGRNAEEECLKARNKLLDIRSNEAPVVIAGCYMTGAFKKKYQLWTKTIVDAN